MTIVYCKTCGNYQDKDKWEKESDHEFWVVPAEEIVYLLNKMDSIKEKFNSFMEIMGR